MYSNGVGAGSWHIVGTIITTGHAHWPLLTNDCCRDLEEATVTVPADIGQDLGTDYDWKLQTVEQEHLDGQKVTFNQGKVVGGGTILNRMVWTRGSAKDYDSWGDLNDVDGQTNQYNWRWNDLLPYFQKV